MPNTWNIFQDDETEPTAEEQAQRKQKAESIRKMLTEQSTTITASEPAESGVGSEDEKPDPKMAKSKMAAEKKEREHILAMNQILAKQVMEKSRIVAGELDFVINNPFLSLHRHHGRFISSLNPIYEDIISYEHQSKPIKVRLV